jgi:hypothetical protein
MCPRAQTGSLPGLLPQLQAMTALVSGLATLSMGLTCNTPLIIAPGTFACRAADLDAPRA